jgi:hypothetical protein
VSLPNGANAQAIAGGMIASALIDFLVEKEIMTKGEARTLLGNVSKHIFPCRPNNPDACMASRIVGGIAKRFAE